MAEHASYAPGGDAQAISKIANDYYGGFAEMFEANGWPERGADMMPAVQRRVVDAYGSVRSFEQKHHGSTVMSPLAAIKSDPPNVWLTSFYGFDPDANGYLGFTKDGQRNGFIRRSQPGVLVVVYATGSAPADMHGKIVGVLQCSHRVNHARNFMSPASWEANQADPERAGRWHLGVKAIRAWKVIPESRIPVSEFANETYSAARAQAIGSQGMVLTSSEALKLLDLNLVEVSVFGEAEVEESAIAKGSELFKPSKPGPVSQSPYVVREAEGPKSLYVLRLEGDTSAFVGRPADQKRIFKVGMSASPATRKEDHNRALPRGAFHWTLMASNAQFSLDPFPTSKAALAGEGAMKAHLAKFGESLGGEFFLASEEAVFAAWQLGLDTASAWGTIA